MADQIYRVKDPTGAIREISGPAGASDAEVIARAQELFSAPPPQSSAATALNMFGPVLPGAKLASDAINKVSDIAGSGVTEGASRMGLSPEVSAGLGTTANLATNALIAYGAGKLATGASPVMESGARRLMQSSIKPNMAARQSGNADKAITTMLDQRINATTGGMEATQSRVSSLETTIDSILKQSPATVDKFEVAKNLKTAVQKVNLNLDKATNIKDIQKAFSDFWSHDAIKNLGNNIPVHLANKMKQSFYKELMDKVYQPGAQISAYDRAEKALAAGLRSEVAKAEPAVAPLLADQSKLINVLKVAGPQVSREGNKNIIGLGALSPSAEKLIVWMLDRYPWFKSELAHAMYAGSERIPQAAVSTGVAAGEAIRQKLNPQ